MELMELGALDKLLLSTMVLSGGTAGCFLSCEGDNDAGINELISPLTPLFETCNGGHTSSEVEVTIENIGLYDRIQHPNLLSN